MTTTELIEAGREWGKQLTEDDARELTAQIRTSVQELLPKIRTAYRRRADLALGYAGWDEYCDAELTGLRLPLGDRQKAVEELRSDGMSQRAIASALRVGVGTVNRDLAGVPDGTPDDKITGTDRKAYAPKRPQSPGPADPTTSPTDPGSTPAPAVDHSTTAPAVPPQEPDPDAAASPWGDGDAAVTVAYDGRVLSVPAVQARKVVDAGGAVKYQRELIELWTWEELETKRREAVQATRTYSEKVAHYNRLLTLQVLAPESSTPAEAAEALGIDLAEWLGRAA